MKYLLFGTGDYYNRYKKWFSREEVTALLDNAPDKQNSCLDGLPIVSPEQGIQLPYDVVVILSFYVKTMKRQLIELGVPEEKIYHFYDMHKLICGRKDASLYKKEIQYYGDAKNVEASLAILLMAHDLTMGGPSLALYHMAHVLRKQGNTIVVASMLDGPLREVLVKEGIPVIVDVNLQVETMRDAGWPEKFSLVVCNTINFYVFLSERKADTPIIWWLHDSPFFYDGVNPDVINVISGKRMQVCAVGSVARKALESFRKDLFIEDLLYGVADETGGIKRKNKAGGKIYFVTIGYIEARKGQDILIEAIRNMPEEIRKKAVFYIVGQDTSLLAGQIRKEIEGIPEVVMMGVLDRDKIHKFLEQADVLVCPSREDPMPTVAAEAMMHGVPCILSDAAGTVGYIRNGVDGIVFHSGNVKRLAESLVWCIENPRRIWEMGIQARKVYEKVFSMNAFENNVMRVLSEVREMSRNKGGKIAIYGLGAETERVLGEIGEKFQVVGLLDSFRSSGSLYGRPIISLEQAVAEQVRMILVAARPGSCRAIARRIGGICRENQIALFDTRGNDLCNMQRVVYDFKEMPGYTKGELMQEILTYDVVSFDLFDTLIMRQVLFPSDVFELVDDRLRQHGIMIEDFSAKRMASEKELSRDRAPKLVEIYSHMKHTYRIAEIEPEQMAVLEWEIDCGLVVPRREICRLFSNLEARGKKVYIVTDSYYNKKQIIHILKKCGITHYTDVFVSCEYGRGKTQGLFYEFKEITDAWSYLHIGDDVAADVESAEKTGISACRLYSGIDFLEQAGYMGLWDYTQCLSDRVRIGMFVANVFNNPFQFETKESRIGVHTAYDIGYVFFAPMICDFVLWFREQVEKYQLENILFCARDGYLVKQLYDELCNQISSVYFLTSRMAAIRAGMENEEDIRYVGDMKFSGSLFKQLEDRFGIQVCEAERQEDGQADLLDYAQEILDRAAVSRENYCTYIERLGLKEGATGFFDFVAKGTTQMYIGRMMEQHLKGIYFLRLEREQMKGKDLDIISFYDTEEMNNSVIFRDYYILETMLTAPMPSVKEFDKNGNPVYAEETRRESDIRCFQEAQEGIRGYFREYLKLCPISARRTNKNLDEIFLTLIHGIEITDKDFLNLKVEDAFFNRMTDMTDML